ncbi:NUDIX hydrolase [Balneola vulgaris]|jgi:8-oxo-dGTP pyrophosphatase MutT (NUDIX family)|uniref:NUDIX hydrolase n=1 Tax=Balneola vulgaris TaxID=287535 RepID=UPI0003639554|nr:NUDIX hydrolase [Balneola vulgaris]
MSRIKRKTLKRIKEIQAGGGVVFKYIDTPTPYVLLIKRNGIWDIPKGKLEKGEDLEECAIREVAEEVNADLPQSLAHLINTQHTYREKGREILKTTYWYVMRFNSEQHFTPQQEEGIEEVAWTSLDKAKAMVGYQNLKEVLVAFEDWLEQNPNL